MAELEVCRNLSLEKGKRSFRMIFVCVEVFFPPVPCGEEYSACLRMLHTSKLDPMRNFSIARSESPTLLQTLEMIIANLHEAFILGLSDYCHVNY